MNVTVLMANLHHDADATQLFPTVDSRRRRGVN